MAPKLQAGVSLSSPRQSSLEQARQFLDVHKTRVVRSAELEAVTGLSRYELACQFRLLYGTSQYRYLLMRRLDGVREQLPCTDRWPR